MTSKLKNTYISWVQSFTTAVHTAQLANVASALMKGFLEPNGAL